MKKFLKRFIKLSWKGIPIGIIVTVLIGTAVLATVLISVTQTITQEIEEPYVPPEDYGEVTVLDLALSKVDTNSSFSRTLTDAVVMELGGDGEGKGLKIVCNADPLYSSFGGTITLTSKPDGSEVGLYGYGITGGGEVTIQLDVRGTYLFDLTVAGTTGSEIGSATSTITYTLEDTWFPPPR